MENVVKTAIILASSREYGNTQQLANLYMEHEPSDLFNLTDYSISVFDYQHRNQHDDFLGLINTLVEYDHLVFATPVYWYSMSAQLKIFIDRLSDLLTIEKKLGRALKGKSCSILATGADNEVPECFVAAFKLTANYFGIKFTSTFYCSCKDDFIVQEHVYNLKTYLAMECSNGARQTQKIIE